MKLNLFGIPIYPDTITTKKLVDLYEEILQPAIKKPPQKSIKGLERMLAKILDKD